MTYASWQGSNLLLTLHVQPGAKMSAFAGLHGEALKIRIQAPPLEGRANLELCRFIAREFGVATGQVQLLSGESSRHKRICVHNPEHMPEDLLHLLPPMPRKL